MIRHISFVRRKATFGILVHLRTIRSELVGARCSVDNPGRSREIGIDEEEETDQGQARADARHRSEPQGAAAAWIHRARSRSADRLGALSTGARARRRNRSQ